MTAASDDVTAEPLELATAGGGETHLADRVPCGPHPIPVVDCWWGILADVDCVICRIAARNQILRRQEGRLA